MIPISRTIEISEDDIVFKASRSGGPGGQNVNKVNTRVTLFFDAANCATLSDAHKQRILKCLAGRADKNGVIRVVSQKHRTQRANRAAAIERLQGLLAEALKRPRRRKKMRIPASAHRKRLEEKKRRGALKRLRSERNFDD